jgi:hypothetical protein
VGEWLHPPARTDARLLPALPPRPPDRRRRRRTQARRPVLVPAHPPPAIRPPAAVADRQENATARDPRRRPERRASGPAPMLPARRCAKPSGRSHWQPRRPTCAWSATGRPPPQQESGRERDTGARITQALEAQVARQAQPQTPALRHVIGPRPKDNLTRPTDVDHPTILGARKHRPDSRQPGPADGRTDRRSRTRGHRDRRPHRPDPENS